MMYHIINDIGIKKMYGVFSENCRNIIYLHLLIYQMLLSKVTYKWSKPNKNNNNNK